MDNDVTNGILANKIENLTNQVSKLEIALGKFDGAFISRDVFELRMKELDLQITTLRAELTRFSSSRWIQNTLAAIFGAALSLLLAYFVNNIGG